MIYLVGGGDHAKVIAEILESSNYQIAGVFEKDLSKRLWSYPFFEFPGPFNFKEDMLILSIGSNEIRKRLAAEIDAKFATAIHASSVISRRATIGEGTVIMANVVINSDSVIGKHCIINTSASIDHDCVLNDYVHISPNATLSGNVTVGECTHIGAGATVIQGIRIGKNVTIGAGAVVIKDIPDNSVAVGCPARVIKTK